MTSKKPAPAGSGFGLGLLSAALISVARSKGGRRRAPARDRYVDPVTETLVPRRMEGSQWRPGQMTRVRTRQGEPFKLVPLEDLEVDRTGAEYPITEAIQVGARDRLRELNRKRPKPIKRPSADDVDQREIRRILGINDSFRDGADGLAKILGSQDLGSASVDDLGDYADAKIVGDILDQFIEPGTARYKDRAGEWKQRRIRFSQSKRGRELLGTDDPDRPGRMDLNKVLRYVVGQGKGKISKVPIEAIREVWDHARENYNASFPDEYVGPIGDTIWDGLDLYSPETAEYLAENDPDALARLVRIKEADELEQAADRYRRILTPPRGKGGADERRTKKCVPRELLPILRHRERTIRAWSENPDRVPDQLCELDPEQFANEAGRLAPMCLYPQILADLEALESACGVPYAGEPPEGSEYRERDEIEDDAAQEPQPEDFREILELEDEGDSWDY